jgi:hypothetical protein
MTTGNKKWLDFHDHQKKISEYTNEAKADINSNASVKLNL